MTYDFKKKYKKVKSHDLTLIKKEKKKSVRDFDLTWLYDFSLMSDLKQKLLSFVGVLRSLRRRAEDKLEVSNGLREIK